MKFTDKPVRFGQFCRRVKPLRLLVACIIWATSALVLSLSAVAALHIREANAVLLFALPWVPLLTMTVAWIIDAKLSPVWPIAGLLSGIYAVFHTAPLVIMFAPAAVPFAIYLVFFHLRKTTRPCR